MGLRYAYNTNGCAHHRLPDALALIAEAGYDGVALTLDWHHIDPMDNDYLEAAAGIKKLLEQHGLACVIETGARFLLDHRQKHEPTLINPTPEGRARRIKFLKRAVEIGAILDAETVSFWAGVRQVTVDRAAATKYLVEGLEEVTAYADDKSVTLSFEPEPGMLIETNAEYRQLLAVSPRLNRSLKLALDLGHVWVTGEGEPVDAIYENADRIGTVSIEGMNRGVHLHLPLDQGDLPIPPLLGALRDIKFGRLVCVELSRESPRAHQAIPESLLHLRTAEKNL